MDIKVGILKNKCHRHEHKFHEIIIYTQGCGELLANEAKIPFFRGTIAVLPPYTQHESLSNGEFERIFINGNFDWILSNSTPIILQGSSAADGLFMADLIYRNRYGKKEYLTALINAFISFILQNIDIDNRINSAIRNITNEITNKFHDSDINVSAILQASGYSEDYIRAEFKKATGKTPVELLTEARISHACLLIDMYKKSLSLTEIAEKCGYTDYVYFSRRFKEIMGISPRVYLNALT